MTFRGKLAGFFPVSYFALILGEIYYFIQNPSALSFSLIPASVYLLPVSLFRIFNFFSPLQDGVYDLKEKKYNAWWTSHMLQFPFIALPWLEGILHLVPGLYSTWLRSWGARIGKNVHWAPRTEIVDRPLIQVGDHSLIGHLVVCVSHLVEQKGERLFLVVKTIKIGSQCLITADAQLGPGAHIPDQTKTPLKARLYWRGEWK